MTDSQNNVAATEAAVETAALPAKKSLSMPLIGAIGVVAVGAVIYAASVVGGGFGGGSQAGAMYVSSENNGSGQQFDAPKSDCGKSGKPMNSTCQH